MDLSVNEQEAMNAPIVGARAASRGVSGRLRCAAAISAVLLLSACATSDTSSGNADPPGESNSKSWLDDTPLSYLVGFPAWIASAFESSDGGKEQGGKDVPKTTAEKNRLAAVAPNPVRTEKAQSAQRAKPRVTAPAPAPNNARPKAPPSAASQPESAPEPLLDPKTLVGLDEREVMRVLGLPDNVRTTPPATVWSYKQKKCALELFFYLDIATDRHRVLTYEVESARGTKETKKVCLGRIIQSALRTN